MSEYLPLCARWEARQAVYDPAGLPVIWDRAALPLPLVLQLDAGQAPYAAAVQDAARLWNRELGFTVFRVVTDPAAAKVFVTSGSAGDGGAAATTHAGDVVPESAAVELRAVGGLGEAYGAAVHELGHVLGLADADSGCMGPLPEGFDPSHTWWLPRDREIDYLRSVYHR
jgi:hypothetical protein